MSKVENFAQNNSSLIQSTGGTLVSITLESMGQKIMGSLVTPASWALNYADQGKMPDTTDVGIYGTSLAGGLAGPAAIATGIVKAVVDDDMERRLREVRQAEQVKYRGFIKPCYTYSSAPPLISAMKIANSGGTAWLHPNGLWVYITDANGFLVVDFKPNIAIKTYRPKLPLTPAKNGGYLWDSF